MEYRDDDDLDDDLDSDDDDSTDRSFLWGAKATQTPLFFSMLRRLSKAGPVIKFLMVQNDKLLLTIVGASTSIVSIK